MCSKVIYDIDSRYQYLINKEEEGFVIQSGSETAKQKELSDAIWQVIIWIRRKRLAKLSNHDLLALQKIGEINVPSSIEELQNFLNEKPIVKRYYSWLFNDILTRNETISSNEENYFLYSEIIYLLQMELSKETT